MWDNGQHNCHTTQPLYAHKDCIGESQYHVSLLHKNNVFMNAPETLILRPFDVYSFKKRYNLNMTL